MKHTFIYIIGLTTKRLREPPVVPHRFRILEGIIDVLIIFGIFCVVFFLNLDTECEILETASKTDIYHIFK